MTLLASLIRGSVGFAIVSVAAFSVWAFGASWFQTHGGEMALYAGCFVVFALLSGLLLHSLVLGTGSLGRFYCVFTPAFLAYSFVWTEVWLWLGPGNGEWLGSFASTAVFAVCLSVWQRNFRALPLTIVVLFVTHSAGYFLGEKLYFASMHKPMDQLIWGLLYGFGFGAGIGYGFWAAQRK